MTRRKKVLLGGVAGLAVVLGGAGTAYAAHFQDRALPGSTVAGRSVAGLSRDEVAAAVRERADDVEVTLEAGEATRTASLADLGYAVDVDATVDAVFANRTWSTYATSLMFGRECDDQNDERVHAAAALHDHLATVLGHVFPNADADALATAGWSLAHGLAFLHLDGKLANSDPAAVDARVRAAYAAVLPATTSKPKPAASKQSKTKASKTKPRAKSDTRRKS